VVTVAEREGKTVDLIVVPGVDPFDAMVQNRVEAQGIEVGHGRSARAWIAMSWRVASGSRGRN